MDEERIRNFISSKTFAVDPNNALHSFAHADDSYHLMGCMLSAAFIGMSMDTTREEMTQAVLEGVAFGLRDSLEVVRSMGVNPQRTKIKVRCGAKS